MELQGCRFGRLVVLKKAQNSARVSWVCLCDCGNKVVRAQVDLRSGDTKSCGCLRKELTKIKNTVHGMAKTAAYKKWKGMWARVRNAALEKNKCYANISVCKRWEKFENFFADMGEPPSAYSLDRIDNSKGYNKHNCRWVPLAEQARNTRRLRKYKGVHISAAARNVGLTPDLVFDRINKLGWSVERALATPKRKVLRCLTQKISQDA